MDGVRAYWDGHRFLSRQGKHICAPEGFTCGLPNIPLDGELWMGRGQFENLVSILKSSTGDWNQVGYNIFDLPSTNGPYSCRIEQLNQLQLHGQVTNEPL